MNRPFHVLKLSICMIAFCLFGSVADAAPPEGAWKLRVLLNEKPISMLVNFSQADGKWVGDFIDSRPALKAEPKITDITVNGESIQFNLSIAGKEIVAVDGMISKDGKKILAAFSAISGPLQLTELTTTKLKKLDDPYEINRETFETMDVNSPELFEVGFEILPGVAAKKAKPEDVRGIVDRLSKAAATYGSRWDRNVALKIAGMLVDQPGFADIALAQARRAERMLAEKDSVNERMDILDMLQKTLTKADKADEAKPLAAQIVRLEARDFADYVKASPFGEVPEYKGRKAKSDRVVVVEAFVGTEFPLSGPIEQSIDILNKTYKPGEVIALNYHYHLPEPNAGDPLTTPDTLDRLSPLIDQIQKAQFVFVNGKSGLKMTNPTQGKEFLASMQTSIEEQLEKPAGCKLTLAVSKGTKGFDVKANIADLDVGTNKINLRFAVIEPRIRFAGGSGARYHTNVVRAVPGGKGFAVIKAASEQTIKIDPEEIRTGLTKYLEDFAKSEGEFPRSGRPMELKNLSIVAFVQNDSTGEILNATVAELK